MARDISSALRAEILADSLAPVFLVAIGYDGGTARLWTGHGELTWDGHTWLGGGELLGIGAVTETTDLQAAGLTVTISGIAVADIERAMTAMRQGLPAKLWFACLDQAGAIVGDPLLLFSGLTDVPSIEDGADTATIGITAENRLARLRTPKVQRYTSQDQKLVDPDDRGFEYVEGLQDREVVFGRS